MSLFLWLPSQCVLTRPLLHTRAHPCCFLLIRASDVWIKNLFFFNRIIFIIWQFHTCEQLIIILCTPTPLPTLPRHPQHIPLSFTFSASVRRGALEAWLPQQGWPESCILFSFPRGTILSQSHRGRWPWSHRGLHGWLDLPSLLPAQQ